jgi:hypothetical protein
MLRFASLLALVSGFLYLTAFRSEDPFLNDRPFPVNTTIARFFLDNERAFSNSHYNLDRPEADTLSQMRVLLLNYTAYDSAYVQKIHKSIQQQLPRCVVTDFWDGSIAALNQALLGQDAVVVVYPATGSGIQLKGYSTALNRYMQQGGGVIVTGTHEFSVLQQLDLFDLDFGYYCKNRGIHTLTSDHPVLAGIPTEFNSSNYLYPLDVSDPQFVSLAEIGGYPVVGYKNVGSGKVVYIGIEYYYDEEESVHLLQNALSWMQNETASAAAPPLPMQLNASLSPKKRSEEYLYTGSAVSRSESPQTAVFDLKIYPNPYMEKATLDIEMNKAAQVSVEMTDESGRIVAVLLPRRQLNAGVYRIEVPNLAPGIYFVQCQTGDKLTVKKVVKTSSR